MNTNDCKKILKDLGEVSKFKRLSKKKLPDGTTQRVFGSNDSTFQYTFIIGTDNTLLKLTKRKVLNTEELCNIHLMGLNELIAVFIKETLLWDLHITQKEDSPFFNMSEYIDYIKEIVFDDNPDILTNFSTDNLKEFYDKKDHQVLISHVSSKWTTQDTYIPVDNELIYNPDSTVNKALDGISVSAENNDIMAFSSPVPMLRGIMGGDWEHPITYYIYALKGSTELCAYIPETDINYDVKKKKAYDDDDLDYSEKEMDFVNSLNDDWEQNLEVLDSMFYDHLQDILGEVEECSIK